MERVVHTALCVLLLLTLVSTLPNKDDWDIYSFHINSTVTGRYAITVITSRVANRMQASKEIEFQVRIPKNAFISKFKMFIDGQVYDGVVKAKEQAQQQYTEAVSHGQSAGLVSSVGRTLEEFKTSVTVAAHKKVTFELTYEELLIRRLGKYELQIHARPMQPVKDFKVDVYIHEKAGINFMEVKGGLSTNALVNAINKTMADKEAWVYFYPTEDQQKTCDSCGAQGMNGDLVIVYDINRDNAFGDIKNSDGYFVHHFAPFNLPHIPKNVVFVIDQSGSMQGRKIQQTRSALLRILNDLTEHDHFGLITFNHKISYWKRELVQARKKNVDKAKGFAQNIEADGYTNINEAVLQGANMVNSHPRDDTASILILLTDGDPTTGETNREKIESNVRQAIADKFPLYCLGFGFDVNFEFLERMSLQNNGVARRIYEDSDADLQLMGFYEEVATPLLTNVMMTYAGANNLTQTYFSQYYNGSEIVVAGKITDNNIETLTPEVVAISGNGRMRFVEENSTIEPTGSDSRIQRVWAYLTVKQLLERKLQLSGPERDTMTKEALELSLKYSFVTPLTSMVVTKPLGEKADVLHKPKEGENPHAGDTSAPFDDAASFNLHLRMTPALDLPDEPVKLVWHALSADDYWDYDAAADNADRNPIADSTFHRFLLKTEKQSLPLCFDVPGQTCLKLLHHPNRELSINGILDSEENRGFKIIGIHYENDQYVEIDTSGITVKTGVSRHVGRDLHTANLTVIGRDKEFDVAVADVRMVILIHQKDGNKFLWPVLRQQSSDNNVEGILALNPAVYEEVQQPPPTKLKINSQVINVTRSTATDYSISSSPVLNCWFMSADSALQRNLNDFTVAQL